MGAGLIGTNGPPECSFICCEWATRLPRSPKPALPRGAHVSRSVRFRVCRRDGAGSDGPAPTSHLLWEIGDRGAAREACKIAGTSCARGRGYRGKERPMTIPNVVGILSEWAEREESPGRRCIA